MEYNSAVSEVGAVNKTITALHRMRKDEASIDAYPYIS